jgi:dCTP diphosphatase
LPPLFPVCYTGAMKNLVAALRQFVREREWDRFHSPKNLSMALSVEVAEVVELFQWLTEEQSRHLDERQRARLEEEIGDVMIYLATLADAFGIDPLAAAAKKVELNKKKYPADLVRAKALKYTEYEG